MNYKEEIEKKKKEYNELQEKQTQLAVEIKRLSNLEALEKLNLEVGKYYKMCDSSYNSDVFLYYSETSEFDPDQMTIKCCDKLVRTFTRTATRYSYSNNAVIPVEAYCNGIIQECSKEEYDSVVKGFIDNLSSLIKG